MSEDRFSDPKFLYKVANRVASRVRIPPTLERDDVVQDAVLIALQLHRDGWQPPATLDPELSLVLKIRQRLGGHAAYREEFNYARRCVGAPAADPVAQHPPVDGDVEQLRDQLVSQLPPHLRDCARRLLTGTPVRAMHTALGINRARARHLCAQVKSVLQSLDLWHDDLYTVGEGGRHRSDMTGKKGE